MLAPESALLPPAMVMLFCTTGRSAVRVMFAWKTMRSPFCAPVVGFSASRSCCSVLTLKSVAQAGVDRQVPTSSAAVSARRRFCTAAAASECAASPRRAASRAARACQPCKHMIPPSATGMTRPDSSRSRQRHSSAPHRAGGTTRGQSAREPPPPIARALCLSCRSGNDRLDCVAPAACPGRSTTRHADARLRWMLLAAPQTRDRSTHRLRDGPGSAAHHNAIKCTQIA